MLKETIVIGSDHAGFRQKSLLVSYLEQNGYLVIDIGTDSEESVDYPDFAAKAAKLLLKKEADFGILLCGSGIGMTIAANRFKGVRAALCHEALAANLARQHNDANFLVMGSKFISDEELLKCANMFLTTNFEAGRHERRVQKLENNETEQN